MDKIWLSCFWELDLTWIKKITYFSQKKNNIKKMQTENILYTFDDCLFVRRPYPSSGRKQTHNFLTIFSEPIHLFWTEIETLKRLTQSVYIADMCMFVCLGRNSLWWKTTENPYLHKKICKFDNNETHTEVYREREIEMVDEKLKAAHIKISIDSQTTFGKHLTSIPFISEHTLYRYKCIV